MTPADRAAEIVTTYCLGAKADHVAEAIARAIEAERERCAALADLMASYRGDVDRSNPLATVYDEGFNAGIVTAAEKLADSIRDGDVPRKDGAK